LLKGYPHTFKQIIDLYPDIEAYANQKKVRILPGEIITLLITYPRTYRSIIDKYSEVEAYARQAGITLCPSDIHAFMVGYPNTYKDIIDSYSSAISVAGQFGMKLKKSLLLTILKQYGKQYMVAIKSLADIRSAFEATYGLSISPSRAYMVLAKSKEWKDKPASQMLAMGMNERAEIINIAKAAQWSEHIFSVPVDESRLDAIVKNFHALGKAPHVSTVRAALGIKSKIRGHKVKTEAFIEGEADGLVHDIIGENRVTGPPNDGGQNELLQAWRGLGQTGFLNCALTIINSDNLDRRQALLDALYDFSAKSPISDIIDTLQDVYFEDGHAILVHSLSSGTALSRIAPANFVDYLTDSDKITSFVYTNARIDIIFDAVEIERTIQELNLYRAHPQLYQYVYALSSENREVVLKAIDEMAPLLSDPEIGDEIIRLLTAALGHNDTAVQRRVSVLLNAVYSGRPLTFPVAQSIRIVNPGSAITLGTITLETGFDPLSNASRRNALKARIAIADTSSKTIRYRNLVVEPLSANSVTLHVAPGAKKLIAEKGMIHIALQVKDEPDMKWRYVLNSDINETIIVQPDIRGSRIYQLWPHYMGIYAQDGMSDMTRQAGLLEARSGQL